MIFILFFSLIFLLELLLLLPPKPRRSRIWCRSPRQQDRIVVVAAVLNANIFFEYCQALLLKASLAVSLHLTKSTMIIVDSNDLRPS